MSEQAELLKARTRRFALDVIKLILLFPSQEPGPTIRRQLAKSATSMDMNYRASCRARSHAEFTAKIGIVAEEADASRKSRATRDLLSERRYSSPQTTPPVVLKFQVTR
jgi:four helix bundle protein